MNYKNGREAKNGDKVVLFTFNGNLQVGILYDAQAGNDYCNGKLAPISINDPCPNLKDCLHMDDVVNLSNQPKKLFSEDLSKTLDIKLD